MYFRTLLLALSLCHLLNAQNLTAVYPFSYGDKWGVVDSERQQVLAAELDTIGLYYDNNQSTANALAWRNNKCGMLNRDGGWMVKPKLDSIGRRHFRFHEIRWAKHKGRFGLLKNDDGKAKWLVKPRYDDVSEFGGRKTGLAAVSRKGRWGVINTAGEVIVKYDYDAAEIIGEWEDQPFIKLQQGENTIFLDANGQPSEEAAFFDDDDIAFEDSEIYEEAPLPQPEIEQTPQADGSTLLVLKADLNFRGYEEQLRLTIPAGHEVTKTKLIDPPSEFRYIQLRKDGKYGFIDNSGTICTPVKYDQIKWQTFSRYEKLPFLYLGDDVGLANWRGEQILPAVFSSIKRLPSRLLWVTHPSGYAGYATYGGVVYLPAAANLTE